MIDARHELVKLAALVDREVFRREWATSLPSHLGRPATSPRVVAGLMYLRHAFKLSDEAVVARWVESPYHQHFTGETFFQHRPPIDPSSLTRWRKRIGGERGEINTVMRIPLSYHTHHDFVLLSTLLLFCT